MSNFTVTIEAHEICEAIKALASAILAPKIQPTQPVPAAAPAPAVLQPDPAPVVLLPMPAPPPVPTTVPPAPVQTAPIPTAAAPVYTTDQLAVAATQLVDAGRRGELVSLINSFGVSALTQLPKNQYGAFATALREMGAKL